MSMSIKTLKALLAGADTSDIRWKEDCERIAAAVLAAKGIALTLQEAQDVWEEVSDRYCAGWLHLPNNDQDIIDSIDEWARD